MIGMSVAAEKSSTISKKVRKVEKIRNRSNQVPQLTQDTTLKVTKTQLNITNESPEVSSFPAGDRKAMNRRKSMTNTRHK